MFSLPPSQRIPELDALRGIAALSVVFFHYTTKFGELYGHPSALAIGVPLGHYGVQLFFCISGFVIAMTLDRTQSWRDFVVSRFSRLYPSFWIAVLLTFTVVSIFGLPGKEVGVRDLLGNLSMVPALFRVNLVDGVYWTLQVELFFYVLMLVLHLFGLLKRLHLICAVWLGLHAVYVFARIIFNVDLSYSISAVLILPFFPFFAVGIVAYDIFKKRRRLVLWDGLVLLFANVLVLSVSVEAWVVHCLCVGIFLSLARGALGFMRFKPFMFFGSISYALYLLHENIGWVLMRKMYGAGMPPLITISLALLAAIGLSYALVRFVEQPSMRMIRQKYKAARVNS